MKPEPAATLCARLPRDARIYQIAFQAILLTVGVLLRDFALDPRQMALAFAAGLVTQLLWLKALGLDAARVLKLGQPWN
jgi:indole-3-glycerol phosphate synthase